MEENIIAKCKLKITKKSKAEAPAFMVDFSNGCINLGEKKKSLNFRCYRHIEDENVVDYHARRVLSTNNGRLSYSGRSASNSDQSELPVRYFVGVRRKSSNKMKVFDSEIFYLKPLIRNPDFVLSHKDKDYKEKLDDLNSSFGSKEKKRAIASRLKYSVDSTPLIHKIADITNTPNHPVSVTSTSTEYGLDYMPSRNSEAQTVDEVYSIYSIISEEEDAYLTELAEKLNNEDSSDFAKLRSEGIFTPYFLSRLDDNKSICKMKYLIYYNYLVLFSKLKYNDFRKKDPAPNIPEPIKRKLLERFTITSFTDKGKITRSFPIKMKDKLISYILVLILLIDGYSINIASVANDLNVGIPKITNISQALGCHIYQRKVQDSSLRFAELKLPLSTVQKYYRKS